MAVLFVDETNRKSIIMKAIVVSEFGSPERLQLKEVADPIPGAGEVVVAIRAAGVNPVETYRRSGKPPYHSGELPYTPGTDGAGEIVAVGAGVSRWNIGDSTLR